ncbi:Hypothetical protein SSO0315 [Saccharolobus solfataricus P2]|uniref:Uncharacterized protein n=3 Tax=Saccharolobus solfataricus TaxID=2287 RepID=Q980I0_SACS2|nr:Hypothetical protein SSO0315 [Saccharolobus solfataricus P2]SAI83852.1 uncharacterised protein [Saccharolobus solfataricus]
MRDNIILSMFIKNMEANSDIVYEYINRVIVAVINAILSYKIFFSFLPIDYVYFVIAIISVISFFFYKPLSIIFLAIYIIESAVVFKTLYNITLLPLIQGYSIEYLIELLVALIFIFIIPLFSILKYSSIGGVITSSSILLSIYNPFFLLFLPFGIAEKNSRITVNILSVLPLLILIVPSILSYNTTSYILHNYSLWVSIILALAAGILFGISQLYSLIGSIPLSIFLYLNGQALEIITLTGLLTIILNIIPSIVSLIKANFYIKKELVDTRKRIIENLDELKGVLEKIKLVIKDTNDIELTPLIQKYNKFFADISSNLENISDMKTLQNLELELNAKRLELERSINDYLFDQISRYNEIVDEIKNYGIVLDKIEPLSEAIKINDEGVIKIRKLLSRVNVNVQILYKYIESIYNSLELLLGKKYNNEITDIRFNIEMSIKYFNRLLNKENLETCKTCTELMLKFLQLSNSLNLNANQELLKNIIKLSDEKPAIFVVKSKEFLEQGLKTASIVLAKVKEEYEYIKNEIPSLSRYKEFDLINLLEKEINDSTKPICKRIETLSSSFQVIQDLSSIIAHKSEIADVINLINDNYDLILQKVIEEGCIKLSELGIALDYGKFIDLVLQEKGTNLRVVNDSICYMR